MAVTSPPLSAFKLDSSGWCSSSRATDLQHSTLQKLKE